MTQIVEVLQGNQTTEVEFPDDMSPQAIEEVLRREFPSAVAPEQAFSFDPEIDKTFSGYVGEIPRGLARGVVGIGESIATGLSSLLPEEQEQAAREKIAEVGEDFREPFLPKAGYEDTLVGKLSEGVGSTAPFLLTGPLGLVRGTTAAIGLGAAAQSGEAVTRAVAEGATEEQIDKAAAFGVIPGVLEGAVPLAISRNFLALRKALGEGAANSLVQSLRRVAVSAGSEGLQEASSEIAQNLIAQNIYSPETGTFTNTGEAFGLGAGVGGIIQGLFELALPRNRAPSFSPTSDSTQNQARDLPTTADLSEITQETVAPDLPATEPTPDISDETLRAETEEKLALIAPNLRGILKGRGLDDIGMTLSYSIDPKSLEGMEDPQDVNALFDPATRTILLGADRIQGFGQMDAPQLQQRFSGLVDHEMVHAVKRMNLWNAAEWGVLENAARRQTNASGQSYLGAAQASYGNESAEIQSEEAIAELIRDTLAGRTGLAGQPLSLMRRLVEFFRKMGNALTGTGYASFGQVVNDIDSGVLGARPRGGRQATPVATPMIGGSPALASRRLRSNAEGQQVMDLEGMTGEEVAIEEARVAARKENRRVVTEGLKETRKLLRTPEEPLASRGKNRTKSAVKPASLIRPMNKDHIYHVTTTENAKKIAEEGLQHFKTSNWVEAGSGERYGGGDLFAMESELDAVKWAGQMDWTLNQSIGSGKISIIKMQRDSLPWSSDEADFVSQAGNEGKWLRRKGVVKPENILDYTQFTIDHLKDYQQRTSEARSILEDDQQPLASRRQKTAKGLRALGDLPRPPRDAGWEQRAKEQGFDTGRVLYHATNQFEFGGKEFERFIPSAAGKLGPGVYTSPNPDYAQRYIAPGPVLQRHGIDVVSGARAIPLFTRGRIANEEEYGQALDFALDDYQTRTTDAVNNVTVKKLAKEILEEQGFAGIERQFSQGSEVVIFDPKNLRSIHANFDPARTESTNLLASRGRLDRAKEQGFDTDTVYYHASTADIDEFKAKYPDGLVFLTNNPEFATNWLGKGGSRFNNNDLELQTILKKDIAEIDKRYEERLGSIEGPDGQNIQNWPQEEIDNYFRETGLAKESISKTYQSVYPLLTNVQNTFDPRLDESVIIEYLESTGRNPLETTIVRGKTDLEVYKDGNYLLYESKDMVDFLKSKGYDSMKLAEDGNIGGDFETLAVFDPENIRSVNAEFDSDQTESPRLLASRKLKTKPEDSAALAEDKSKAATEVRGNPEADQAASEQLRTVKKLASRNKPQDIVESTAYNRVADISSKRASRGQGNINNALPFEAPSSADDKGIVYQLQDKYIDLKNAISAVKDNQRKRGLTPLIDTENPYLGEESMHGIIGNKFNRFQEDEVKPIADKLVRRKIARKELEEFLVLRHAIERNTHVRELNAQSKQPRLELEDGGAGSLNGERLVDDYVKNEMRSKYRMQWNDSTQSWEGGNRRARVLNDLAADFDAITRGTLQELKDSGLINQDSLDKLKTHYKYYAPLRGVSPDEDIAIEERARISRGAHNLSIGGIETEKAKGRVSEATPPLGQIMMQRQNAIRRGTINDVVGQRMLKLIRENPNDSYWKIHEDREYAGVGASELFGVKEDGKQLFVEFKDKRLRDAMLSLDAAQTGKILGFLRMVNRYYSAIMTQYNPEFVIGNFARDVGTAMGNLVGEQTMVDGKAINTKGLKRAVVGDTVSSIRQVYRGLRGKDLKGDLARDWKEYLESGAKTEWFNVKTPEESSADIDQLIAMAQGTFKGNVSSAKESIGGFVSDANSAVENGVRFATFKKARDLFIKNKVPRDLAVAQAATLAKNLTVNFNRKGNSGELLNGLYLFFNASVQGTANFARGLSSPAKQRMLAAMVSFGALMTLLNEESSEEDDKGDSYYSQIEPWVKERNLVIMKTMNPFYKGDPAAIYTIPLPYGYNVLHVLGMHTAEVGMGIENPQQAAGELVSAALGSFAPVGFGTSSNPVTFALKGATPQIGKPIMEILLNEDFFGAPVYTENFEFGPQVPLSYLSQRSTPEIFKRTTKFLNEMTKGNESKGGKYLDLSWISPDALDYLVGTQIGGVGSFAKRTAKSIGALSDYVQGDYKEGDISVNDIPFLRRGMREITGRQSQSDYYDRRDDIIADDRQVGILRGVERGEYIRENRPTLRMKRALDSSDKRLRNINKRLAKIGDLLLTSPSIEQSIKFEEEQKRLTDLKQAVYDRFNKLFNQRVGRTE